MSSSPRKTQIKICGITSAADAQAAAEAGAAYLGFIFVRESPRYIEPEKAGDIAKSVSGPRFVGVTANQNGDKIERIISLSGVEMLQFHGDESPEFCRRFSKPWIKAFRPKEDDQIEDLEQKIAAYAGEAAFILLDAWSDKALGGTGKHTNWDTAAHLSRKFRIMLAGGLNPANVKQAIEMVNPVAVDISSGVEDRPGVKNHRKMNNLFEEILHLKSS